jgi:general secretion pathway protein E
VSDSAGLASIIEAARQSGVVNLREIAINKMLEGVTTYEEVISMTG